MKTNTQDTESPKESFRYYLKVIAVNLILIEILSLAVLLIFRWNSMFYYSANELTDFHKERLLNFANDTYDYDRFSKEYGWSIKPSGVSSYGGRVYESNSQGIRADHIYPLERDSNYTRIASFGDSFVHGDDVDNNETWQYYMEKADSSLQVLNFGIGAFSTDQAYLRYKHEGQKFSPDIVLIGFTFENMFRNVNVYRPFYAVNTRKPLVKPRYQVQGDSLTLIPTPFQSRKDYLTLSSKPDSVLKKLGMHDYWYDQRYPESIFDYSATVRLYKLVRNLFSTIDFSLFYDKDLEEKEYYKVSQKILEQFYADVIRDGAVPVIVFFPNSFDFVHHKTHDERLYKRVYQDFKSRGYNVLDLWHIYEEYDFDKSFMLNETGGHYSPQTNQKVSASIIKYLNEKDLLYSN